MSQQDLEVVRKMTQPYDGRDIIPMIRAGLERFGPDPDPDLVLAFWAEDPSWRYMHPDFEWDSSAVGTLGTRARGPKEVALWWADWAEAWKSYVYRTVEHRDLGGWVLTPIDVEALGPGDIPVAMRAFQSWKVRDGRIAACRVFLTESDALEAAG